MTDIAFSTDADGFVRYHAPERLRPLAHWLTEQVGTSLGSGLNLLADLADIADGRKASEVWDNESWTTTLRPAEVTITNTFSSALKGTFTLAETRDAAWAYWRFLAGDGHETADALAEWEEWEKRTHPRRSEL